MICVSDKTNKIQPVGTVTKYNLKIEEKVNANPLTHKYTAHFPGLLMTLIMTS